MQSLLLLLYEMGHIGIFLRKLILQFFLENLDLVNLHLISRDALLDRIDWSSHLVGNSGIEHCGKILLTHHIVISLSLGDIDELDHFTLLVLLENCGYLKAEI